MQEYIFHSELFPLILLGFTILYCVSTLPALTKVTGNVRNFNPDSSIWVSSLIGLIVLYWIATCPVPWESGYDRDMLARKFIHRYSFNDTLSECIRENDVIWQTYIYLCSKVMNYKVWLFLNAAVYVGNYYHAAYRLSRRKVLPLFIALICGFGFYTYGVNAIKSGIGISFLVLAYTYFRSYWKLLCCLILAICFHISLILPALCCISALLLIPKGNNSDNSTYNHSDPALFSAIYRRIRKLPRGLLFIAGVWVFCFFFSLFLGRNMMEILSTFIDPYSRFGYMVHPDALIREGLSYNSGFRWDFILFSFMPIIAAFGYIIIFHYRSIDYFRILAGYLAANSFWLLIVRVPFTDRIAYFSWFLMPLVLFYPLLDKQLRIPYKRTFTGFALVAETILFSCLL